MKRLLAVALLGWGLSFGLAGTAAAAPLSPGDFATAVTQSSQSAVTQVRGWWAAPLVLGGVVLYHHHRHYRHRHCYRRCYWHRGHRHCYRHCRRHWY
jgi:hypothetical protein